MVGIHLAFEGGTLEFHLVMEHLKAPESEGLHSVPGGQGVLGLLNSAVELEVAEIHSALT